MGVDATLFIVAKWSDEEWVSGQATIELDRDYELWAKLQAIPTCGHARRIELIRASWNSEGYYLFGDSYHPDRGFKWCNVNDLDSILLGVEGTNGNILNFVRQTYAGQKFLIIWY
jgi:hypothetical protein